MIETIIQIWIISGIVAIIMATLYAGYAHKELYDSFEEIIMPTIICVALLPLGLFFIAIASPFYGIYSLGKWLRNKKVFKA